MIIIVSFAVCALCEKKSWWKSPNFVTYKQFSKVVYFALMDAGIFHSTGNASQWHRTTDSKKPSTSALGSQED